MQKVELLLIEDNPREAELIAEMLSESRWQEFAVNHVTRLADGVALLKSRSYDVILADLGLPDSQGLETALVLRSEAKSTPIVVLTVLDDEAAALKSLQMDIQDYLVKGEITSAVLTRSIRYARERMHVIRALRESEGRFRFMADAAPVMVWMSGPDSLCTYFNKRWLEFTGRGLDQEEGTGWTDNIHPEDLKRCLEVYLTAVKKRTAFNMEYRLRRRDGKYCWILDTGVPRFSPMGEFEGFIGSCIDITEHRESEDALKIANAQLQLITESMSIGVARCSRDGRYLWVSSAYLAWLQKSADQIIGHTVKEVIGKDGADKVAPYLERVLQGERVGYELPIRYGDLGERWVSGRYTPTFDDSGTADGWVAVVYDITERKEMEEQIKTLNAQLAARAEELEAANRDLEAFNYTAAHDLRQPLNLICGYSQAIDKLCGERLDEECLDFVSKIYKSCMRMSQLIDTLLNFSRLAKVQPHRETVDLSAIAHGVAKELKESEPERKVDFKVGRDVVTEGDASLLRVALQNLIGNSWKYTRDRENATIEFTTQYSDGQQVYLVRDNGVGFDMGDAQDIFLPFKRLLSAERTAGFGIGLAIVERIITRHGGQIWAEAEPGKGATFFFTLPSNQK